VLVARAGLPAIAIVTEEFREQAIHVARAAGMPGIPRAVIEHPVSGTGRANLVRVATELAPRLLRLFERAG
jgi:hypothetical protein